MPPTKLVRIKFHSLCMPDGELRFENYKLGLPPIDQHEYKGALIQSYSNCLIYIYIFKYKLKSSYVIHFRRKLVIGKRLLVRVGVWLGLGLRIGLELGLGVTKNYSCSFLKMIVTLLRKQLFVCVARHRIKRGSHGIG